MEDNNLINDPETIKKIIENNDSKLLATQVITFRLLGINKKLAIACMAELQRRKENNLDDFNYEEYIKEELDKSPKPYMKKEHRNILQNLFKIKV